jgi:hypothetical protein
MTSKGAFKVGVLFAIYKLVVFENRVVRIMFELKTEELCRKGYILFSSIIYTAFQTLEYQKEKLKMGKECGMHGNEGNLEQIFGWKTEGKESIQKACVNMVG